MSIMGGIGMLSAGLLGSTGLGFAKDLYAGEALQEKNPAIYEVVKADAPSSFLFLKATGLDGTKLSEAQGRVVRAGSVPPRLGLPPGPTRSTQPGESTAKMQSESPTRGGLDDDHDLHRSDRRSDCSRDGA